MAVLGGRVALQLRSSWPSAGAKPVRVSLPSVQIVGYEPTPDAALHIARGGTVERVPLTQGSELSYGLGDRRCAGQVNGSTHIPCHDSSAPFCSAHTATWICARCRGVCLKDEMDCFDDHVVYLAIVAPASIKVGVTKAHRFETRLHEQGADRGVAIHHVENGRIAREIETELMASFPDRISITAKIEGIGRAVNESVWNEAIEPYDQYRYSEPVYDLPSLQTAVPERIVAGRIIGTKGRLCLLETGGTTYVTDLRTLVGTVITTDGVRGNRQSSLGTFH